MAPARRSSVGDVDRLPRELERLGSSRPSFFPTSAVREQQITSHLFAALELIHPFRRRLFSLIGGDRASKATQNLGGLRVDAIVEPRLDGSTKFRADAAFAVSYGGKAPVTYLFEVKQVQGNGTRATAAKLQSEQLKRTVASARTHRIDHVVTLSARHQDDGSAGEIYTPHGNATRTTLTHLSWLDVEWALARTLQASASGQETLEPVAERVLQDLLANLRATGLISASRSVSLGVHPFSRLRERAQGRSSGRLAMQDVVDVAHRWADLARTVERLIENDRELTVQRGTTTDAAALSRIGRDEAASSDRLAATFTCREYPNQTYGLEVDLAEETITTWWEVDLQASLKREKPGRTPQTATVWRHVRSLLVEHDVPTSAVVTIVGDGRSGAIFERRGLKRAVTDLGVLEPDLPRPRRLQAVRTSRIAKGKKFSGHEVGRFAVLCASRDCPWPRAR